MDDGQVVIRNGKVPKRVFYSFLFDLYKGVHEGQMDDEFVQLCSSYNLNAYRVNDSVTSCDYYLVGRRETFFGRIHAPAAEDQLLLFLLEKGV
jgi:hypothetical protein